MRVCGLARGVRIGRRVVKGRFIIFLLASAGLLVWLLLPKGPGKQARDTSAVSGSQDMEISGPAVCIWDEEVFTAPQGQRVEHYVADGDPVTTGDTIADIFPAEGDSSVLDQLNALREDITHHQISILDDAQAEALASLNTQIEETAAAIQKKAIRDDAASVAEDESQLKSLMSERQTWLDEHVNPDQRLLSLYQQEGIFMQKLDKEMVPIIAPADGYVSFSVDGWEGKLSPDLIDYITPADMGEWLNAQGKEQAPATSSAAEAPFFKIIYDTQWYLAVQAESSEGFHAGDTVSVRWNDGSEGVTAEVMRTAAGQGYDLILLRSDGVPTRSRYGYVRVTKTAAGLKVPVNALYQENGRDYIRIEYEGAPTPVEVTVEIMGEEYAVVSAVGDVEGLSPGVKVYTDD